MKLLALWKTVARTPERERVSSGRSRGGAWEPASPLFSQRKWWREVTGHVACVHGALRNFFLILTETPATEKRWKIQSGRMFTVTIGIKCVHYQGTVYYAVQGTSICSSLRFKFKCDQSKRKPFKAVLFYGYVYQAVQGDSHLWVSE